MDKSIERVKKWIEIYISKEAGRAILRVRLKIVISEWQLNKQTRRSKKKEKQKF